jgi:methylenetetrahydrofolate dehydrogenase (NADP+) / methenyltetrahydrofolate cyclohydrolase
MTAAIIDGAALAERMRAELAVQAQQLSAQLGYPPGLGVVLVGDNPASAQYVRMKRRACEQTGIASFAHVLNADASQAEVIHAVDALNADPQVHGILVQLPMPAQIDEEAVLRRVSLEKDVDGFHPLNIGLLAMKGREPLFTPATPTGCMELLKDHGVNLNGANAVVLGRSNIVGLPVALMLMRENATVTVCHSKTKHMNDYLRDADVVIAAMGRPNAIKGEQLKRGCVVIDVGTNRIDAPDDPRGYKFVGDVDFESALPVVGAITKVPGGVGPMTITMLLANTIKAAQRAVQT